MDTHCLHVYVVENSNMHFMQNLSLLMINIRHTTAYSIISIIKINVYIIHVSIVFFFYLVYFIIYNFDLRSIQI